MKGLDYDGSACARATVNLFTVWGSGKPKTVTLAHINPEP